MAGGGGGRARLCKGEWFLKGSERPEAGCLGELYQRIGGINGCGVLRPLLGGSERLIKKVKNRDN